MLGYLFLLERITMIPLEYEDLCIKAERQSKAQSNNKPQQLVELYSVMMQADNIARIYAQYDYEFQITAVRITVNSNHPKQALARYYVANCLRYQPDGINSTMQPRYKKVRFRTEKTATEINIEVKNLTQSILDYLKLNKVDSAEDPRKCNVDDYPF